MANYEKQTKAELEQLVPSVADTVYVKDLNEVFELESNGNAIDGVNVIDAVRARVQLNDDDLRWQIVTVAGQTVGSGGGGGFTPRNTVIVSDDTPVAGKIFNTYAAARAYQLTQSPAADNLLSIIITGEIEEATDFITDEFISIVGIPGSTVIKDPVKSTWAFGLGDFVGASIYDCTIENYAITGGTGNNLYRCQITGGTPAGGIACLQSGSVITAGDFSACVVKLFGNAAIIGGIFDSPLILAGGILSDINPITISGIDSTYGSIELGASSTMSQGVYKMRGGVFKSNTRTLTLESGSIFQNIASGAVVTLAPIASANVTVTNQPGQWILDGAAAGSSFTTDVQSLQDFADDAAAGVGGIPVGGRYRTGSIIKFRVA